MVWTLIDWTLFFVFAVWVLYILFFSVLSLFRKKDPTMSVNDPLRFAVLIPAYKEDLVIEECVESCLKQQYPREMFDVVVISDGMSDETNLRLSTLPIRLVKIDIPARTKTKALNIALSQLDGYDIALILDADNVLEPDFIAKMNGAFVEGVDVVQAHRIAKNLNNSLAILDAMSEEINNSIFRKGHSKIGLSCSLIGSGMAFRFDRFKEILSDIKAVGGFDKELEHTYIYKKLRLHYLDHAILKDEKVHKSTEFTNQRRRWMASQLVFLRKFFPYLPSAIKDSNWDFCDKVFQMMVPPRVLLVGFLFLISLGLLVFLPAVGLKWGILFAILVMALLLAVPRYLITRDWLIAMASLPKVFLLFVLVLFKLKGADKKFIHTNHG